jgi:hypothetical protein
MRVTVAFRVLGTNSTWVCMLCGAPLKRIRSMLWLLWGKFPMTSACKSLGENRCQFLIKIFRSLLCISRVQTICVMNFTQTLLRRREGMEGGGLKWNCYCGLMWELDFLCLEEMNALHNAVRATCFARESGLYAGLKPISNFTTSECFT